MPNWKRCEKSQRDSRFKTDCRGAPAEQWMYAASILIKRDLSSLFLSRTFLIMKRHDVLFSYPKSEPHEDVQLEAQTIDEELLCLANCLKAWIIKMKRGESVLFPFVQMIQIKLSCTSGNTSTSYDTGQSTHLSHPTYQLPRRWSHVPQVQSTTPGCCLLPSCRGDGFIDYINTVINLHLF